jgi:peptidoglycan/LPS O-acetylase OafA/YrhL
MADSTSRTVRKWSDIVVIVASLVSLGNAIWGPFIFTSVARDPPHGDSGVGYNWLAFGVGGLLGLLGVFLAERQPRLARLSVALGGAMIAIVPFTYEHWHALPIATSLVLGLAMLAAAPFVGPMPTPGGRDRASSGAG